MSTTTSTTARSSPASFTIDDSLQGHSGEDQGEIEIASLPPVDGGKAAWMFVLAAWVLETFVWGAGYSSGTILLYFQSHEPWKSQSSALLTAASTTQLGIQFILPTIVVILFRRYPEWVKTSLWASVAIACGGMLISSWATEAWHLIVLQGVFVGMANAVLFAPIFAFIGEWWVTKRGMALGIVLSGLGFGGFVFPFLIDALLSRGGYAWYCRGWALITAVAFGLTIPLVNPRIPLVKPKNGERGPWVAVDWKFLYDPIFVLMAFASLFSSLSYLPVALYLPQYAASLTDSTTQQTLVLAVFNLVAAFGSAASGPLSDFSYPLTTIVCGICGALISLAAWGMADSLGKLYAFAIFFSFFSQMVSAWSGASKDVSHANPYNASMAFCLFAVVRGIGSIVMPTVSETLYDPSKAGQTSTWGAFGFHKMIIFVGITAFLCAVSGALLHFARGKRLRATPAR
ncbi:hypothetical protein JCM11641_004051 [Rhodosporidiobolus odoratus]